MSSPQGARFQLYHHESLILALQPFPLRRGKPETRIIVGMSEDDDNIIADSLSRFQSLANQCGADPWILVFGEDGHRGKPHRYKGFSLRFNRNRTKKDVAHRLPLQHRDE